MEGKNLYADNWKPKRKTAINPQEYNYQWKPCLKVRETGFKVWTTSFYRSQRIRVTLAVRVICIFLKMFYRKGINSDGTDRRIPVK